MLKIHGLVFMLSKSWRTRKVDSGCRRRSPWKPPQEHVIHAVAECLLLARLSERSPLLRQEARSISCPFPSSVLGKKRKNNLDTTIFRESTKTLFGPQISLSSFLLLLSASGLLETWGACLTTFPALCLQFHILESM